MENSKSEITISTLLGVLKKSFVWLLLGAVLLGCGAVLFGMFLVEDQYTCSITYMIGEGATTSNADLNAMEKHIERYGYILTSKKVIKKVVENSKIDGENIEYATAQMAASTTFSGKEAGVFTITVTYGDPVVAYAMVTSYQELMQQIIEENKLPFEASNIEAPTTPPKDPSNGGREVKYGAIGFVLGAVIVYAVALLREINDTKIRNEQDLREAIELPVVGVIPMFVAVAPAAENGLKLEN